MTGKKIKILATGKKDGRTFTVGQGTYEAVKALNKEKSFNAALDTLIQIKKNHNYLFGTKEGHAVKRRVHGKRKTS
ncbi:hypothetical protein KKF70_02400 [bacterium]|nr:hypothetical protein [bacterium]MBU3929604.1 hypothetical protein [bacterium]MBU4122531.1 hypothetical protein [bacterium]